MTIELIIQNKLKCLVGLQLVIARLGGSMRGFHFGEITRNTIKGKSSGEFSLHIQCPWRIEYKNSIFTGNNDLWCPADPEQDIDWETWNFEENDNLQDKLLGELLRGYDSSTRSFENNTSLLFVEMISSDIYGGVRISLSGGYELVIFPTGTTDEDWRMLNHVEGSHFVIVGGKVESN